MRSLYSKRGVLIALIHSILLQLQAASYVFPSAKRSLLYWSDKEKVWLHCGAVKAGIVWTDCGEAPSESVALAFGFATPLIINDAECDHHRDIDIGRNLDDVGIPAHKQIWKVAKVPS